MGVRKYLSIALIIATGLSLSSCGSPPKTTPHKSKAAAVPINYPPPVSFTVVVPIAYWKWASDPNNLDSPSTPESKKLAGSTPIEYLYNQTCGGQQKSLLTFDSKKDTNMINPPPGKEFVVSKSSTAVTLRVVLTSKQVYKWEQLLKQNNGTGYWCEVSDNTPEKDFIATLSNKNWEFKDLVSQGDSAPPAPPASVTTEPQILPWSKWLPLLFNAVHDLSNNLSICNLGYGQFLAGTLSTLANQAPDQNGMNVLYSDVQNLSQDASSLATRVPCWETKNSFNDDLKQLVQDLKANGYVY